jgi:pimeloyl-ACP methyl ester carboxylesterase
MKYRCLAATLGCVLVACTAPSSTTDESTAAETASASPLATMTEAFDLPVDDGITLQGKLDLPTAPVPQGGWPLIVLLEGSGPIDVDFTSLVPNADKTPRNPEDCKGAGPDGVRPDGTSVPCYKNDQLYATRAAALAMAVARVGKRGVTLDAENPFLVHKDMAVHGTGTLTKRVADVGALVRHLAQDPRLDTSRVYLWGVSEGSAVSELFASQNTARVGGLILVGPVLESVKDLYRFQTVTVQFDQLLAVADADGDRRVTKEEYASAQETHQLFANPKDWSFTDPVFRDVLATYGRLGRPATFETFDENHDGTIDRFEVDSRLDQDFWQPFVDAVERNDAASAALYDTDNSVAQLRDEFATPSLAPKLFAMDFPITVIVGERDLNTPASQLDWFVPAAAAAGRSNISTTVIENKIVQGYATGHHYGPGHVDRVIARLGELHWPKR